jgi:transglutaminase-like putative cysteine protease
MNSTRTVVALTAWLLLAGSYEAQTRPEMDYRLTLAVTHPEIIKTAEYAAWPLSGWSETRATTQQTVVLHAPGPRDIAAKLVYELKVSGKSKTVLQVVPFSTKTLRRSKAAAVRELAAYIKTPVIAATATFDLSSARPIIWELETAPTQTYRVAAGAQPMLITPKQLVIAASDRVCIPGDVDAASKRNDLHHADGVTVFQKARELTDHLADLNEKVEHLCDAVFEQIPWKNRDLDDIFTDSDQLVLAREFGICDEKAVVLVSYLRAIDIPARMKILRWTRAKKEWAHAVVECLVNGNIVYLDPTFGKINEPAFYRTAVVDGELPTNLRVVDVDSPDDSRSIAPVNGAVDDSDSTDGRLSTWDDFCYTPNVDGDPARAPYTN